LTEYLYRKGIAYFHTPSAVLRNHIEDLLTYYYREVDNGTDRSKDLNIITHTYAPTLSSSPMDEGQENQEEVIHHNESAYEEMPQSTVDYVLEQIISRYGTKLNYNILNEDRLEVLSRANELSRRVSVDLLQKVDDLAKRAK
jgi:hypothetical protein